MNQYELEEYILIGIFALMFSLWAIIAIVSFSLLITLNALVIIL